MKNILAKIYIHPFTYLVILISLLTGLFKELVTFLYIIIIHELGHIIAASLFKWNIKKVKIMPFGGLTIFEDLINKSTFEEIIVLLSGPGLQFINYLIFKDITPYFNYYNYGLFIFNMLPIYPMDGYRLLFIILTRFIPYKKVISISLIISLLVLLIFIRFDLIYIIILFLLLVGIINEFKNIKYIYNKFLFERFIYNIHFKKYKKIKSINNMYKDKMHLIYDNNRYITEKEALEKYFHKKL